MTAPRLAHENLNRSYVYEHRAPVAPDFDEREFAAPLNVNVSHISHQYESVHMPMPMQYA